MKSLLIATAAVLFAGACAPPSDMVVPPDERSPLEQRIGQGDSLNAQPIASRVAITGQYMDGTSPARTALLSVLQGRVDIGLARGQLWLDAFELDLGDIIVYPAGAPIHLTAIHFAQDEPAPLSLRWLSDDGHRALTDTELTLRVDWAMVSRDGVTVPLTSQDIARVPAVVELSATSDGRLSADVQADYRGIFWDWSGIVRLSDLDLHVQASDRPAAPIEQR